MNSRFQEYYSHRFAFAFPDLDLCEEMFVPPKGRIDLGSKDYRYGIEFKSGYSDLKSGCGLNQRHFTYGYVICPQNIAASTIGYLYLSGMDETGVIGIDSNDKFVLLKPARYNHYSYERNRFQHESIASIIAGWGDNIGMLFREYEEAI